MRILIIALFLMGNQHAFGGEIFDRHRLNNDRTVEPFILGCHKEVKHGITEIGIERAVCFGTCPAYTFIVNSDGTFRYTNYGDSALY